MEWNFVFFANSILLGIGLAMDAFSVSMANGLNESNMRKRRMCLIAGIYGLFQFSMPMIGWVCVHTIVEYFNSFNILIPWISLALLCFIGGKTIFESLQKKEEEEEAFIKAGIGTLLFQGIATSIDALSVGFTTADYGLGMALISSLIICVVTFFLCLTGLLIGKKAGNHLKTKASVFGGIILIVIGIEIFIKGFFFGS